MTHVRLALIGFGNVGQGFAHILLRQREAVRSKLGVEIDVVAICDAIKGNAYDPHGLDLESALERVSNDQSLTGLGDSISESSPEDLIASTNCDTVVEMSFTDLTTGQPATRYIEASIACGKHVITTNKGPIAINLNSLQTSADNRGLYLGVEGTVLSGTPAIALGGDLLSWAGIKRITGILNGTTNFILGEMANGESFDAALSMAQEYGYAEAEPSGDVDGIDAAGKVVILANMFMGANIGMSDVETVGIRELTSSDVERAKQQSSTWKLVGDVEKDGEIVRASVRPVMLDNAHPLASVSGPKNAITFGTEFLGNVTLVGAGAGRIETGYAVFADVIRSVRHRAAAAMEN